MWKKTNLMKKNLKYKIYHCKMKKKKGDLNGLKVFFYRFSDISGISENMLRRYAKAMLSFLQEQIGTALVSCSKWLENLPVIPSESLITV